MATYAHTIGAAPTLTLLECATGGGFWLGFQCRDRVRFHETVAALKDRIPAWARQWDPQRRAWHLADQDFVLRLRDLFPGLAEALVVVLAGGSANPRSQQARHTANERGRPREVAVSPPAAVAQAFTRLGLSPTAPPWLVAMARRGWAREAHPDAGGSHAAMVRINDAADVAERWALQHSAAHEGSGAAR